MNILELKNISYTYDNYSENKNESLDETLKNINLKIEHGKFISILGKNGSGKSTLAKIISRILLPTSGILIVDGKTIKDRNDSINIFKNIGMIFQNPDNQLISSIVEEDVAFGPENMNLETEEIRERVEESLKKVGMLEYRYSSPNKLSGGQKQKVAIAGILATRPKCIIFDEPTSMLDPISKKEIMEEILKLNRNKNISIILITHDAEETVYSDELIIMNEGKIVISGSPKEIYSKKELLEEYGISVPQATLISYELKKMGINIEETIIYDDELIKYILNYSKKGEQNDRI